MQKAQQIAGFTAAVLLLAGGGWALYRFAIIFGEANPTVQASIIAGVVALGTVLFTFWKERSRLIKEAHREQKIAAYSEFYDIIFNLIEKTKKDEQLDIASEEFMKKMFKIMRSILFYGSPDVVLAFSSWRVGAASTDSMSALRSIGKILLAMRSDIGLINRGLNELNIHQIYINDDVALLGATT
jgi:hypothetical protein